jgi:hypothetical protein
MGEDCLSICFIPIDRMGRPPVNVFIPIDRMGKPPVNVFIPIDRMGRPPVNVFIPIDRMGRPPVNVFIPIANPIFLHRPFDIISNSCDQTYYYNSLF